MNHITIPEFLVELKSIDSPDTASKSLDFLYYFMDTFTFTGRYDTVNEIIEEFIKADFSPQLYIGLLLSILPFKGNVDKYSDLYFEAFKLIKNSYNEETAQYTLRGLEN